MNQNQEQFEWWITNIDEKISNLKKKLPYEVSKCLDNTIESIDVLENFMLQFFNSTDRKIDFKLCDQIASYIAAVYKLNIANSKWHIELEDEKNVFFNKPGLQVNNKIFFYPHSYVTSAIDRRKGNFISQVIKNQKNISE
ncbi:MAG: hypothetical protein IPM74_18400 [Crocinitomicaceae bacterium]|nr:hypothetical protein [Crocinitomicaceae bacterium]MBK8927815.1 hypothetical protein [Crocinitomicaceae bacterium]